MRAFFALSLVFSLTACARADAPRPAAGATSDWRAIASAKDRERLRNWRSAFTGAVGAARRAGHGDDIDREGALLQADAALGGPIPNGDYRCRVIKLGAKSPGLLDFVAYPFFTCRVAQRGPVQSFAKLTGSQRQIGTIYPAEPLRQLFLGTLVLGDEPRPMHYGGDEMRNVAGYVERIGPQRWRLVMPRPHFESQLDVMELVPTR